MAESSIEWTEKTWNPVTGCTSVGKECDNCYARTLTNRYMHNSKLPKYKKGFDVVVEHKSTLNEPYNWSEPRTVFVNSMSDLFHRDISLDFIKKVFKVMNETPQHTYQILTKRDHLLMRYSKELVWSDNIWMGVSVGVQSSTKRIENLRKCGAKKKFLSVEPLIEEITEMNLAGIDLVFVGGESGDNSVRPMKMKWVLGVKKFCDDSNVPFFFKQWGKDRNNPDQNDPTINKAHSYHAKGGCMVDGKLYLENPSIKDDSTPTVNLFGKDYYIMDEHQGLVTIWELKAYLPMMEDELFKQLKDDIRKNGMNDPILYYVTPDGLKLVIEGHTRLSAALKNKLKEIPMKQVKETFNSLDEIKLWMIRHQFQRRNMSSLERVQLAYLSKDVIVNAAKENLSKGGKKINVGESIDTNAEIARIANVGRTTVVRYVSVLAKASKTVLDKLKQGELSISAAHSSIKEIVNLPIKAASTKTVKKVQQVRMLDSIEKGKNLLLSGNIEALVIVKEMSQLDMLSQKQKDRIGVYLLKGNG